MPVYLVFAVVALVVIELLYFFLAKRFNVVDVPNARSSHSRPVLRGGGVIFFFAVLFYAATHQFAYLPFVLSALLLAVVSFVDDVRSLPSLWRLAAQVAAVAFAFFLPLQSLELWKSLLVLIVFSGVLNIYNFMDGINGMLAAYSLVVVGTFVYIDLCVVPFVDIQFLLTILVAILIFAFFNFRSSARCFSGDVGSIVMALIVLFLLVSYVSASPSASPSVSYLTFILVFLADGGLTLLKRFLNGANIFQPHRQHLYETLVNDMHIPHLYVATAYALLQLLINVGYFWVVDKNLYIFVCALTLVLLYGLFFFYFNRRSQSAR